VPELEELARTVAWLLDVPAAIVTLVDDRRQFFAAQVGLAPWAAEARGTPLSHSFCQHVVSTGRPLVVSDARAEPLVADNLAIEELDVVAYAGIPLVSHGQPVGSLCAIDTRPRTWRDDDLLLLQRLAERALAELGRAAAR
jgi:GAF domain-containing protein